MDPFTNPADFFKQIQELITQHKPFALVTVTHVEGSTPRKAGSKMVVLSDGTCIGTVGGGLFEKKAVTEAQACLTDGVHKVIKHNLDQSEGAMCGGSMQAFIEPYQPQPTLIQIGCGHVGKAVLNIFNSLSYRTVAVEGYEPTYQASDMPQTALLKTTFDTNQLQDLPFGSNTYVVIATRGHEHDEAMASFVLKHEFAYLGIIGSRKKATAIKENLARANLPTKTLKKIHTPIGLDIGAQTPQEIAISIAAEIIASHAGKETPAWS